MADDTDATREQRRAARARWPIARFRLGAEPSDDLSATTTPAERLAMMWPLAVEAWRVAARPLPDYDRRNMPARVFRPGTRPPTMSIEGLNDDFRDLLILFVDAGVEFLVVGAYALAFHGAPRASGDIDVFVRPDRANAARVVSALARFGAPLEAAGLTAADFTHPGLVYQIGLPPRRVDILTEISGLTFDEAWASRVAGEVEGRTVSFIGRAALLKNKDATGRLKDAADAARLRQIPPHA